MPLHVPAGDTRSPLYLLTVTLPGEREVWRYASAAVTVTTTSDPTVASYDYRGGLTVDPAEEVLDIAEPVQSARSVPVAVAWSTDLLKRLQVGSFARASAELAVIADGDTWEERRVIVSGILSEPVEDQVGVVAASVVEDIGEDGGLFPDEDAAVVKGHTWTYPDEGSIGAVYPLVFGEPGVYVDLDGVEQTCGATPMPQVYQQAGNDLLMVAGRPVEATAITAYDGATTTTPSVSTTTDDLGRKVAVATFTSPPGATSGTVYWAAWDSGGGVHGLGSAGALMRYLLAYSRVAIDWGRLDVAVPSLDRWLVDGYIDARVAPLAWLRDVLLPVLPVTMASGPGGMYPAVVDWRATADDAVLELTEGRDFFRIGPRSWEGADDVATEIRVAYALDAASGDYRRTIVATGDPATVGDPGYMHTEGLRRAWSRWGRRSMTVETDILYRDRSAALTASWLAWRYGGLRGVVTGDLPRRRWSARVGDVVAYTDVGLQLYGVVGWIRRMRWVAGTVTAEIVLGSSA